MLHFVVPLELVRQQVTKPLACFPQIDLAAHLLTAPRHSGGTEVLSFTWCATHDTYCPWLVAVVQLRGGSSAAQAASAAARAASISACVISQAAFAHRAGPSKSATARRPRP